VAQYILLETTSQPALVLREIVWPPDLEDRSALRRLAVTDSDDRGPMRTAEADAIRIIDDVGNERLRCTRFDHMRELYTSRS
jgi:hypothetical protein